MKPNNTDEELLSAFLAGQRGALGEIARRYERPLLGLTAGLLGGRRDLACDAVQETWLRVIRFGEQFMGRSSFKTWIYRIAVNQCHSLQAARAVPQRAELSDAASGRDAWPDDEAEAVDQNHALRRAVERLEADKRLVILLCYHSGMTHEQAADVLELPLGTLKSRLHAALTELRATLSAEAKP